MLLLARRNLLAERTRLLISVGGVALAVFLISLLLSLYRGWSDKVGGFVEDSRIDLWVVRDGTTDFLGGASIIPLETADSLSKLEEVDRWSPLIVRPMEARKGETKMDVSLIGYRPGTGMGGPLRVKAGKPAPGAGEVIIDEAMADRYGISIGDSIRAAGQDLQVAGISSGGNFVFWQTAFVSYEEAERLLEQPGFATFLLVELREPSAAPEVIARIESGHPGLVAIPGDEFAEATRERIMGEVLPVLMVILVLSFIVGLAVAGLTIYTATVEKWREWGVLKAVGFGNRYLYRVVLEQSVLTGLLGFFAGVGLTLAIGRFASDLVPQFVLSTQWPDVLLVAASTLLMAVLAAYVPVRRLGAIDPVAVFRA